MIADFFQDWLQQLTIPWWGVVLMYLVSILLLDMILCLIFGGKARLRELLSDPVHVYWLALVPGAISIIYVGNWRVATSSIASLAQNGIDISAWRYPLFVYISDWWQWSVLAMSLVLVAISCRRYLVTRRGKTWFAKLPLFVYLLRSAFTDLPLAYMVCITVSNLIDSTTAFNRIFVNISSAIGVDGWHSDGLYGLRPAYELLLGQLGVGLLVSFLPMLMLRREAKQPYSSLYRVGTLLGITAVIVIASIVLYNFNSALEQVKLSTVDPLLDELRTTGPSATSLAQEMHRVNLLLEYQIAESLPSMLPIPGWLKALGTSRLLLLALEFYSLLQPTLKLPKMPPALLRLIKAD